MTTLIDEAGTQLIERFLDGDLTDTETDAVTRRLATEPSLAAALEQARQLRDMRATFFQSLEPNDAEARAVVNRARAAARRIEHSADRYDPSWRWIRLASAAAALIMIGFMSGRVRLGLPGMTSSDGTKVGLIGSLPGVTTPQSQPATPAFGPINLVDNQQQQARDTAPASPAIQALWQRLLGRQIAQQDNVGNTLNFGPEDNADATARPVADSSQPVGDDAAPRHFGTYQVELRDSLGHTVAVQRFNSLEEARDFVNMLQRFGSRPQTAPVAPVAPPSDNGGAVLVHDQF